MTQLEAQTSEETCVDGPAGRSASKAQRFMSAASCSRPPSSSSVLLSSVWKPSHLFRSSCQAPGPGLPICLHLAPPALSNLPCLYCLSVYFPNCLDGSLLRCKSHYILLENPPRSYIAFQLSRVQTPLLCSQSLNEPGYPVFPGPSVLLGLLYPHVPILFSGHLETPDSSRWHGSHICLLASVLTDLDLLQEAHHHCHFLPLPL